MTPKPDMVQPVDQPQEISRKWMNVVRRLRSTARGQMGIAFVKVIVMVDKSGEPVIWTDPKLTLIEPKLRVEDVLDKLDEDEMAQLLRAMVE